MQTTQSGLSVIPTLREGNTLAMAEYGEETSLTTQAPRERNFALSSRRVKGAIISWIATEFGVPTRGSLEDRRQMVQGMLTEAGREPRNVVICVLETGERTSVCVEDESGVFMELPLLTEPRTGNSPMNSGEDSVESESNGSCGGAETEDHTGEDGVESRVEVDLWKANAKIVELQGEVSALGDEIECKSTI